MRISRPLAAAVVIVLATATSTRANVGETYGFGSRAAALASAGVATSTGAYSSYYNPAALPAAAGAPSNPGQSGLDREGQRLAFDLGLVYMVPSFLAINNVVITNSYTSGASSTGTVDTSYRETLGEALGLSYRLLDGPSKLTAGLTAFLPFNQVAFVDTGDSYAPEYVLYRARTQRPQVEFAIGGKLSESWSFGVGLHLAFALTSNASVFLQTAQTNQPSTMRFIASMKSKFSPYLGAQFAPTGEPDRLTFGAVARLPATSDSTMVLKSAAHVGFPQAIDFSFAANSALFYDPLTLELGGAWQHSPGWKIHLQADYQAWSAYQAPALSIVSCTDASTDPNCGVVVHNSANPGFTYRNIVIPRVAEEVTVGSWVLRAGYAYRPSFMENLPTGAGNYLDPPKHMIQAGVGRLFPKFLGSGIPARIDFNLAYHALVTQRVDKTAGDEVGNTSSSKIGAPGYDAGGKILGGGVSLSLAI